MSASETELRGPPLLVAMLCAPLIGVASDDPAVLHAVTMDEVYRGWSGDPMPSAACGVGTVRIVLASTDGDGLVVEWPPRVASLPTERSRCRACWEATGRKRPRSKWMPR